MEEETKEQEQDVLSTLHPEAPVPSSVQCDPKTTKENLHLSNVHDSNHTSHSLTNHVSNRIQRVTKSHNVQQRPLSIKYRCKNCFSLVLLTVFLVLYSILGGFLFSSLESSHELSYNSKVTKWKNDTAILLATELRQVPPYEDTWARTVFHYLDVFERDLLKAYRRGYEQNAQTKWSFTEATFFSVSLLTTIGSNEPALGSQWSQSVLMIYTAIGIPLAIAWMFKLGSSLATLWIALFIRIFACEARENRKVQAEDSGITRTRYITEEKDPEANYPSNVSASSLTGGVVTRNPTVSSLKNIIDKTRPTEGIRCSGDTSSSNNTLHITQQMRPNAVKPEGRSVSIKTRNHSSTCRGLIMWPRDLAVPTVFSFILLLVYFILGVAVISVIEGWALIDSTFFIFVMFTTIGPNISSTLTSSSVVRLHKSIFFTVYLVAGFCLISMILNLLCMQCKVMKRKRNLVPA